MSELKAYSGEDIQDLIDNGDKIDLEYLNKQFVEKSKADKEIRRLNRALYKMAANWALSTLAWLDCIDQGEPRKWSEMVQKCRAKAEEYK